LFRGSRVLDPAREAEAVSTTAKIDVGVVLGAGRELELHQAIPLPDFESYSFPVPAEVRLTARRLGDGLELEGTVDATAVGACARCLNDVRLPLHLDVLERLEPPGGSTDPFGENNVLAGDHLDLADLVRQLIDSALPIVLLCDEHCPGLCPTCGKRRDGACSCGTTDPE
jgi:uncharacterized protein